MDQRGKNENRNKKRKTNTVKLGDKELFGHPKIVPYRQVFLVLMK